MECRYKVEMKSEYKEIALEKENIFTIIMPEPSIAMKPPDMDVSVETQ